MKEGARSRRDCRFHPTNAYPLMRSPSIVSVAGKKAGSKAPTVMVLFPRPVCTVREVVGLRKVTISLRLESIEFSPVPGASCRVMTSSPSLNRKMRFAASRLSAIGSNPRYSIRLLPVTSIEPELASKNRCSTVSNRPPPLRVRLSPEPVVGCAAVENQAVRYIAEGEIDLQRINAAQCLNRDQIARDGINGISTDCPPLVTVAPATPLASNTAPGLWMNRVPDARVMRSIGLQREGVVPSAWRKIAHHQVSVLQHQLGGDCQGQTQVKDVAAAFERFDRKLCGKPLG